MSEELPRLGEILVVRGLASREAVVRALYYHQKLTEKGRDVRLGEVLVGLGIVDREEVNETEKIISTMRMDKALLRAEILGVVELAETAPIEDETLFGELGLDSERIALARLRGTWREGLERAPSPEEEAAQQRSVLLAEYGPEKTEEALGLAARHSIRFSALKRVLRYQTDLARLGLEEPLENIARDQGFVQGPPPALRSKDLTIRRRRTGPLGWVLRVTLASAAVTIAGAAWRKYEDLAPAPAPSGEGSSRAEDRPPGVLVSSHERAPTRAPDLDTEPAAWTVEDDHWRSVEVATPEQATRAAEGFRASGVVSTPAVPALGGEAMSRIPDLYSPARFAAPSEAETLWRSFTARVALERARRLEERRRFADPEHLTVEARPLAAALGIAVEGEAHIPDGSVLEVHVLYSERVLERRLVTVHDDAFRTGFLLPSGGPDSLSGWYALEVWYRPRLHVSFDPLLHGSLPVFARDEAAIGTPELFAAEDALLRRSLEESAAVLADLRASLIGELYVRRAEDRPEARVRGWGGFLEGLWSDLRAVEDHLDQHEASVYGVRYPEILDALRDAIEGMDSLAREATRSLERGAGDSEVRNVEERLLAIDGDIESWRAEAAGR